MTQITKVGHFYMAQLGHYHVAATEIKKEVALFFNYVKLILEVYKEIELRKLIRLIKLEKSII